MTLILIGRWLWKEMTKQSGIRHWVALCSQQEDNIKIKKYNNEKLQI